MFFGPAGHPGPVLSFLHQPACRAFFEMDDIHDLFVL